MIVYLDKVFRIFGVEDLILVCDKNGYILIMNIIFEIFFIFVYID